MKNIFKNYADYFKDNPHGYWFRKKLYGWGWTPVTWQGWLVVGVYILCITLFAFTIDENSPPNELMFTFFLPIALLTAVLIRIAYKKGEKPSWQWGPPKKDK